MLPPFWCLVLGLKGSLKEPCLEPENLLSSASLGPDGPHDSPIGLSSSPMECWGLESCYQGPVARSTVPVSTKERAMLPGACRSRFWVSIRQKKEHIFRCGCLGYGACQNQKCLLKTVEQSGWSPHPYGPGDVSTWSRPLEASTLCHVRLPE